jgi:predicted DCC family thiol-disulfide oxidoreductase YuxK
MNELPEWPKIVYFDGVCILCNRTVDFLIRIDRGNKLKFATLQSNFASKYLPLHLLNIPAIDTVIFQDEVRIYTRSSAILKVLCQLGFPWNLSSVFYIIPPGIRDWIYNFVARNRYGWFGKRHQCRVPDEITREKIIG